MKKILLLVFSFPFLCVYAQEIKENKVDEFTKHQVIRTSWEMLAGDMKKNMHFRLSKIDTLTSFDLKIMLTNHKAMIIEANSNLMLMLDNKEVITLKALSSAISCKGCGATGFMGGSSEGIEANYYLQNEDLVTLKKSPVIKMRIYTNDGYIEHEMKDKHSEKVRKAAGLL